MAVIDELHEARQRLGKSAQRARAARDFTQELAIGNDALITFIEDVDAILARNNKAPVAAPKPKPAAPKRPSLFTFANEGQ